MAIAPSEPVLRKARYPSQARITRMLRAAAECGLKVHSVEVTPTGRIKVVGDGPATPTDDDFSRWEAAGRL